MSKGTTEEQAAGAGMDGSDAAPGPLELALPHLRAAAGHVVDFARQIPGNEQQPLWNAAFMLHARVNDCVILSERLISGKWPPAVAPPPHPVS